jgi:hypothetical protein
MGLYIGKVRPPPASGKIKENREEKICNTMLYDKGRNYGYYGACGVNSKHRDRRKNVGFPQKWVFVIPRKSEFFRN